ncbi:hypothetical protein STIAU_2225 [Stigmatella aurantiaca DW4/3-1]|uniref:Uncharacterized protein n=1 Tax=Stigmatella aurantiaca (strain DW4/3-1) TaxID=378806 RepID=Q08T66_STIAD|nr:hypothetical protein STIAU_2225 [Stigmatella aurantiaca DW4/3-1]
MVLGGGEAPGLHPVQVEPPFQVVELVLENAGVPALGHQGHRGPVLVQRLHADTARPGHQRREAGHAQTPLVKFHQRRILHHQRGVDEDVEVHRLAFARGQVLRLDAHVVLGPVLHHHQPQPDPDLGRREPHARCVPHRVPHELDELLHLGAGDLLGGQLPGPLPQHRLSRLDDLQHHRSLPFSRLENRLARACALLNLPRACNGGRFRPSPVVSRTAPNQTVCPSG